jgi:hypothetical protein
MTTAIWTKPQVSRPEEFSAPTGPSHGVGKLDANVLLDEHVVADQPPALRDPEHPGVVVEPGTDRGDRSALEE